MNSTQCAWGSATRENCSLRIRQLLFEARISKPLRVTDIRAAALTKLINNGATKEEADRWSRNSQSAETERMHYDRNNNQNARETIAGTFNQVFLLGEKLPRRGGNRTTLLGWKLPIERGASYSKCGKIPSINLEYGFFIQTAQI
ncbi:MAG: hypothetical protein EZS28_047544 [Streblomastix strix]|uniref:Tyr recombinase domain-containing protein n=1 Tax=Streblomastix strix TaxID=222440 RepID=A0A5J4TFM4_9EUKA|nr:MAG: hypothetical protein EZS28_047544 [Streblomastix strix]